VRGNGSANGWRVVDDAESLSRLLLGTAAHLHQYPYWNEPLRRIRLRPTYLVYWRNGVRTAFVCILGLGVPWPRIGLIRHGPVSLVDAGVAPGALTELVRWARRSGYIFLRVSHSDAEVLDQLAATGHSNRSDPFPLYPHTAYELIVPQRPGDEDTLRTFQSVARRNLRAAERAQYRIAARNDPQGLAEVRAVYTALEQWKGRVYDRPFESYVDLLRLAAPHGRARVYSAWLGDRLVQFVLVVRDRDVAHYVIGALDREALAGAPSPSVLLHWHAMRDNFGQGAPFYDLGLWGSGSLPIFKRKFRPDERVFPPPVTVVLRPTLYRLWLRALPALLRTRGILQKLVAAR
jgi:hypothetical protein